MRVLSLYVHVPFCERRCSYCSFYHMRASADLEDAYVGALEEEIALALGGPGEPVRLRSVFLGGGTPSALSRPALTRVLAAISPYTDAAVTREFTMELNPEDVDDDLVAFARDAGVDRVSLGVQSMQPAAQRVLRRCSPETNLRAIDTVMRRFDNVSFDVLLGVPGGGPDGLCGTMDTLAARRPAHFSVYCLEPGGDMPAAAERFFRGVDSERAAEEYLSMCGRLGELGYAHYEVSNFALPGRESIHNATYWDGGEYVGVGPAAHSYVGGERSYNAPSLADYLEHRGGARAAARIVDPMDAEARRLEEAMLALRTARGMTLASTDGEVARECARMGLARIEDGSVRLTDRGFLLLDAVVLRLVGA
ncbi:MAG: coproporphyrinogen III oxidase family protein, partial [Candidatus Krumholzibacteria bacterium]|nr:coproporphyrinogen III oxidase family protein [Candidatus Krumholzibacteria bacterium]